MSQCPKCGAGLTEDYGMASCPACGSMLFIDMEGVAHVSVEEERPMAEASPSESGLDFISPREGSQVTGQGVDLKLAEESVSALNPDFNFGGSDDSPVTDSPPVEEPQYNPDLSFDLSTAQTDDSPAESLPDVPFGMNPHKSAGEAPVPDFGPASDPLGINSYANSEMSQAKYGLLVFQIFISGVDTKEIRQQLREAMEDSRLGWDLAGLMAGLKNGQLKIENVTPVKASVLINRIKHLPLQIRWEQNAITQLDTPDS